MSGSNRNSSSPAADRRQMAITGALATERLMEVHFRYAMEMVEHTREQLDPARALAIYARLHDLRGAGVEDLHHRVFVALGRRPAPNPVAGSDPGDAAGTRGPETPRSVIGIIRKRLRGRVNLELREWVEFHTGRAETELLWAHVENALQFVELLAPGADVAEAIGAYASQLQISPARTEIIYYLTLAHLSGNPLVSPSEDPIVNDLRPSLRIGSVHQRPGRRHAG